MNVLVAVALGFIQLYIMLYSWDFCLFCFVFERSDVFLSGNNLLYLKDKKNLFRVDWSGGEMDGDRVGAQPFWMVSWISGEQLIYRLDWGMDWPIAPGLGLCSGVSHRLAPHTQSRTTHKIPYVLGLWIRSNLVLWGWDHSLHPTLYTGSNHCLAWCASPVQKIGWFIWLLGLHTDPKM